jgi:6-pyruvoyltetrahydropterin/6-carboxytetrahydropterin synthase
MKLVYKRKFDAAHRLFDESKTKEWNETNFGKCTNLHGHTWVVEFTLCGQPNSDNSMLINFNVLKELIDSLDHKFINEVIPMLPTAENLVGYFLSELLDEQLFTYIKVKVWESDHAYAEDEWGTS